MAGWQGGILGLFLCLLFTCSATFGPPFFSQDKLVGIDCRLYGKSYEEVPFAGQCQTTANYRLELWLNYTVNDIHFHHKSCNFRQACYKSSSGACRDISCHGRVGPRQCNDVVTQDLDLYHNMHVNTTYRCIMNENDPHYISLSQTDDGDTSITRLGVSVFVIACVVCFPLFLFVLLVAGGMIFFAIPIGTTYICSHPVWKQRIRGFFMKRIRFVDARSFLPMRNYRPLTFSHLLFFFFFFTG